MGLNFHDIQESEEFGVTNFFTADLELWAEVFGFEYDGEFKPKNPVSSLPKAQEGVYRTATVEKLNQPKQSVYKGIGPDNKYMFEFLDPLFDNTIKAKHYDGPGFKNGHIKIYPPFIYSTLKKPNNLSDAIFETALNELDAIITRQDMNFTFENQYLGNSYKYKCPFYLSFLKTQVIIMLVNGSTVANFAQNAENISVEDFGVYCPYYEMAGHYHPAIRLDLEAIRTYAEKEKQDLKHLYKQILLKLLAYAYQDPTNGVEADGTFEKLIKPKMLGFSFSYNEKEADELVKKYLS